MTGRTGFFTRNERMSSKEFSLDSHKLTQAAGSLAGSRAAKDFTSRTDLRRGAWFRVSFRVPGRGG